MLRHYPRSTSHYIRVCFLLLTALWAFPARSEGGLAAAPPPASEESIVKNSKLLFSEFATAFRQQFTWLALDGQENLKGISLPAAFPYVALAPDGATVAYMGGKSIYLQNFQTQKLKRFSLSLPMNAPIGELSAGGLSWSPDGERIVCALGQGGSSTVFIVDAQSGDSKALFTEKTTIKFPVWSPDGKRIAFSLWARSAAGDERSVYVVDADGGNRNRVAPLATLSPPAWSPDNKMLAIAAPTPGDKPSLGPEIFIATADGTILTQITKDTFTDNFPVWLASNHIVYCSQRGTGVLMAIRPDGTGARPILPRPDKRNVQFLTAALTSTFNPEPPITLDAPPLQPPAQPQPPLTPAMPPPVTPPVAQPPAQPEPARANIVFHSNRDGNDEIYIRQADKTVRRLTFNPANDGGAVPSPDGEEIAFTSNRDGNLEIYVMDANGKNTRRVTNHPSNDIVAAWSPGEEMIAFYSNRNGNYDLYETSLDGTALIQLTRDPEDDIQPAYSPDGSRIAFASRRSGTFEIYVMDKNGQNMARLTRNRFTNREPAWSPDGKKIVWSCKEVRDEDIYTMNADGSDQTRSNNCRACRASISAGVSSMASGGFTNNYVFYKTIVRTVFLSRLAQYS